MATSGLEGKIKDVGVGDMVSLRNPSKEIEVGGYVWRITSNSIKLSHENPYSKESFIHRESILFGRQTYLLSRFTHYEIVKKYNPQI